MDIGELNEREKPPLSLQWRYNGVRTNGNGVTRFRSRPRTKVGLVPAGLLVVENGLHLMSSERRAMKSAAIALSFACAVFVAPYAIDAQSFNSLYPALQPPTLRGTLPQLDPAPQPHVSPGSERQPAQPPQHEQRTDATGAQR